MYAMRHHNFYLNKVKSIVKHTSVSMKVFKTSRWSRYSCIHVLWRAYIIPSELPSPCWAFHQLPLPSLSSLECAGKPSANLKWPESSMVTCPGTVQVLSRHCPGSFHAWRTNESQRYLNLKDMFKKSNQS